MSLQLHFNSLDLSLSLLLTILQHTHTHTHAQHLKYKHTHLEKYRQKGAETCVTFKIFSGPFFWIDTYWFESYFCFCQSCNSLFYKPGRVFLTRINWIEHNHTIIYPLTQGCQTQTHVRAAQWHSKTEKLWAGRSFFCSEIHFMEFNKIVAGQFYKQWALCGPRAASLTSLP